MITDLELFNGDEVNPAGFEGVKIGLERATTYENWLKAKVPAAEVAYYDSNEAMYLDLAAGRVDAIMTNPMKAYLSFLVQGRRRRLRGSSARRSRRRSTSASVSASAFAKAMTS